MDTSRLRRRAVGVVLAVAVGATTVACGGGSSVTETTAGGTPTVGTASSTQLLVGRLTRHGEPVEGVQVAGELWPDDTEDLEAGEVVDVLDLRPSTTDADGRWQLRLDIADVPTRYLVGGAGGHTVNLDVVLQVPEGYARWSVPLSRTEGPAGEAVWRSFEQDGPGDPPHRLDMDLGTGEVRDVASGGDVTEGELAF